MKAVNLIPADLRGGGASPSRAGNGVYVLLGALAMAVVLAGAWGIVGRSITSKKADLAQVTAEADAAEVKANRLAPYSKYAELRTKRVETVRSLARSRFNWPFALREVSRVMPSDVWLTNVTGTVAPGVNVEGGGGGGTSLRGSLAVPAIELTGCTTDMANVARFITRLRQIDGVTRVSLGSSEKGDGGGGAGGASSGGGGGGDCRQGSPKYPQFSLVAFFERSRAGVAGAAGATGQTPAAGQPAQASTTQGASK